MNRSLLLPKQGGPDQLQSTQGGKVAPEKESIDSICVYRKLGLLLSFYVTIDFYFLCYDGLPLLLGVFDWKQYFVKSLFLVDYVVLPERY